MINVLYRFVPVARSMLFRAKAMAIEAAKAKGPACKAPTKYVPIKGVEGLDI